MKVTCIGYGTFDCTWNPSIVLYFAYKSMRIFSASNSTNINFSYPTFCSTIFAFLIRLLNYANTLISNWICQYSFKTVWAPKRVCKVAFPSWRISSNRILKFYMPARAKTNKGGKFGILVFHYKQVKGFLTILTTSHYFTL